MRYPESQGSSFAVARSLGFGVPHPRAWALLDGGSCDGAELVDVLRNDEKMVVTTFQNVDNIHGKLMIGINQIFDANKDVRVEQNFHSPRPS